MSEEKTPEANVPNPAPQVVVMQPPQKNWFSRHKFLTAVLALVVLVGIGMGISGGGSADGQGGSSGANSTKTAKIGQPAKDGKFTFTVTKMESGKKTLRGKYNTSVEAQGEFIVVHLTVKNHSKEPQSFSSSVQELISSDGATYKTSLETDLEVLNNSYEDINPGNSVKMKVVFDVPAGTKAKTIELHDSVFSGGVKVALTK